MLFVHTSSLDKPGKGESRASAALLCIMHLYVQEMPSFSLIMLPSLESITASVSPSAFFFRNRFKPEHRTSRAENYK